MPKNELMLNSDYAIAARIRAHLLYGVTAPMVYKSWGFSYGMEHFAKQAKRADEQGRVDTTKLETAHLDALDFGLWSDDPEDATCGLRVIPVWLYPYLKPGQVLIDIFGAKTVVGENYTNPAYPAGYIDNDNRMGCVAYGVIPGKGE